MVLHRPSEPAALIRHVAGLHARSVIHSPFLMYAPPMFTKIARMDVKSVHSPAEPTFSVSRKAIRLISLLNLVLFGLFVVPVAHRWVDRGFLSLRAIHLEDAVGWSLQVWIFGSTALATVLFGRAVWKKRRTVFVGAPSAPLKAEGMLLAAWWIALLGLCVYGFMLGMGG